MKSASSKLSAARMAVRHAERARKSLRGVGLVMGEDESGPVLMTHPSSREASDAIEVALHHLDILVEDLLRAAAKEQP